MYQDLFIIGGTGNVGKELIRQIFHYGDNRTDVHKNPTRIVGVASSKFALYKKCGLSKTNLSNFISNPSSNDSYRELSDFLSIDSTVPVVFIDVTASKELGDFHFQVIEKGYCVVTANKNPLVDCNFKKFRKLTENVDQYGYSCSVMAGAEVVPFLRDLWDLNSSPIRIQGCLSGTLGYVLSETESGKNLINVTKRAKELGYTEPNPEIDFNGMDVAKKLLILARTSGIDLNLTDVNVEPFNYDNSQLQEKRNKALNSGKVLRYLASLEFKSKSPKLRVGLREVEKESHFGKLIGTNNLVCVETDVYRPECWVSPCVPGAGIPVTAQNIRRDLLHLLQNRHARK